MFISTLYIASTEDFLSSEHAIWCAVDAGTNESCNGTHLMHTHGGMWCSTPYHSIDSLDSYLSYLFPLLCRDIILNKLQECAHISISHLPIQHTPVRRQNLLEGGEHHQCLRVIESMRFYSFSSSWRNLRKVDPCRGLVSRSATIMSEGWCRTLIKPSSPHIEYKDRAKFSRSKNKTGPKICC